MAAPARTRRALTLSVPIGSRWNVDRAVSAVVAGLCGPVSFSELILGWASAALPKKLWARLMFQKVSQSYVNSLRYGSQLVASSGGIGSPSEGATDAAICPTLVSRPAFAVVPSQVASLVLEVRWTRPGARSILVVKPSSEPGNRGRG